LRLGNREEYARVDALFEDAGGLALSPPAPGLEVHGLGHGERRRKAHE
jgi:hypothetical protein